MDSVWQQLPYDLVRIIISMAGLNHSCMEYQRFDVNKLKYIPYINFPSFNWMQKFTEDYRIVIISNPVTFSMRMFDSRHNNFPQPDRAVLYTRETGDVRESFMKWDARDGVFVEDIYEYNSVV